MTAFQGCALFSAAVDFWILETQLGVCFSGILMAGLLQSVDLALQFLLEFDLVVDI